MRPGDPPTVPTAYHLLEGMFFDTRRFDLSRVGRLKFNIKMGRPERTDQRSASRGERFHRGRQLSSADEA
jgi:hypothetical protein